MSALRGIFLGVITFYLIGCGGVSHPKDEVVARCSDVHEDTETGRILEALDSEVRGKTVSHLADANRCIDLLVVPQHVTAIQSFPQPEYAIILGEVVKNLSDYSDNTAVQSGANALLNTISQIPHLSEAINTTSLLEAMVIATAYSGNEVLQIERFKSFDALLTMFNGVHVTTVKHFPEPVNNGYIGNILVNLSEYDGALTAPTAASYLTTLYENYDFVEAANVDLLLVALTNATKNGSATRIAILYSITDIVELHRHTISFELHRLSPVLDEIHSNLQSYSDSPSIQADADQISERLDNMF